MTLTRFAFAGIERTIRSMLPELTASRPDLVAYVPRGGAVPAAMVAQYTGLELTSDPSACRGRRVLLVEDLCVTGSTLRAYQDAIVDAESITTFSLVRVAGAAGDYLPDLTGYATGPNEYVMVPWEITDIFDDEFPYDVTTELDGVLRDAGSGGQLLRVSTVANAVTTAETHDADVLWAGGVGINVKNWIRLDEPTAFPAAGNQRLYLCGTRPTSASAALLERFDIIFPVTESSREGRGYAELGG